MIATPYIVFRAASREDCETWLDAEPRVRNAPHKIVHKVRDWLPEGEQWQVLCSERFGHYPSSGPASLSQERSTPTGTR